MKLYNRIDLAAKVFIDADMAYKAAIIEFEAAENTGSHPISCGCNLEKARRAMLKARKEYREACDGVSVSSFVTQKQLSDMRKAIRAEFATLLVIHDAKADGMDAVLERFEKDNGMQAA